MTALIPAIDLLDGQVVRLYQGDYAQQTVFARDPVELAMTYADAGVSWLHVVDLDAARDGSDRNLKLIERMSTAAAIAVQAGGGVRAEADVQQRLDAGVDRVVVGSLAMREPHTLVEWAARFGASRFCAALDVRVSDDERLELAAGGWTEAVDQDFDSVLQILGDGGLRDCLCTDIGRDGTLGGPNFALYRRLMSRHPNWRFQASGGVASLEDVRQLARDQLAGVILGKALLAERFSLQEAITCLRAA